MFAESIVFARGIVQEDARADVPAQSQRTD